MENNAETPNDKKSVIKARSYNSSPPMKLKSEPVKRKSFNVNEAVKSLDLALGRLKKSKLVNGEYSTSQVRSSNMFMDVDSRVPFAQGLDNASIMSMNFSHYELMRNLSRSNCNSDGAFSGTTCSAYMNSQDPTVKNEHLERYFRSAEMWSKTYRECGPSTVHFEMPTEK